MVQDSRSDVRKDTDAVADELRGAARDFVGGDEWKRSKVGYLSGFGMVKAGFRAVAGSFGDGVGTLKRFHAAALGRGGEDASVEGVVADDAGDRFVESMRVHGKTLADVDAMQNSTFRGCVFFALMTVVALAWGLGSYVWSPPVGGVFLPFDFAYRFIAVAPLGALALKWSYTNWMLRRRRYDGLMDYLRSGEWAPERVRPRKAAVAGVPARTAPAPRKAPSARRNVAKALMLALLLGGLLAAAPQASHAQTSGGTTGQPQTAAGGGMTGPQDIFKVPDGSKDLFMRLLSFIAPSVGPIPGFQGVAGTSTPAHQAMAEGFMAFISALFFLAGMQVAWHTVSGIVATAQEGKVLGQKWHQVWAPIRVVSGVGFLAPAFGGFCVAQIVVLYLIAFGGQLANLIWVPYVKAMVEGVATPNAVNTEAVATTIGQLTSTNNILRSIFEKELCYAAAKQNYVRNGKSPGDGVVPKEVEFKSAFTYNTTADKLSTTWNSISGTQSSGNAYQILQVEGQTLDYGPICGKIIIEVTAGDASDSPEANAAQKFSQARMQAIQDARSALTGIADQAAQSYQNYTSASASGSTSGLFFADESTGTLQQMQQALQGARSAYEGKMLQAARDVINNVASVKGNGAGNLETFRKGAQDGGWATAGVYYMTLSRIQSSLYSRASETPIVTSMDASKAPDALRFAIFGTSGKDARPGPVPSFDSWFAANIATVSSDANSPVDPYGARAGASSDIDNPVLSLINKMKLPGISDLLQKMQPSPFNPLGDIISMGHFIINAGWVALIALTAGAAAAKGAAGSWFGSLFSAGAASGVVEGVLGIITPIAVIILLIVFAMGITMAFIIPMIPYIMVLFFIVGMLVLTLEALIAAPLWAFFHVRMDGQDLIDQVQKPGYMIAFNLLLRPSLMILGYILSFFAFGAIAWFISVTFSTTVAATTQGYMGGPITFLVMGGMMAFLYYQAAVRSFEMIVKVPDRVTRWFGAGGENLGEERHSSEGLALVGGAVSRRAEQVMSGPAGMLTGGAAGMGGKGRDAKLGGAGSNQQQPTLENPHQSNVPGGGTDPAAAPAAAVRGAVDAGVQANEQSDTPQRKDGAKRGAAGSSPVADKQTPHGGTGAKDGGKQDGGAPGGSGTEQSPAASAPPPSKEGPSATAAAKSGGKPPAQAAAPAKPTDYSKANPKRLG